MDILSQSILHSDFRQISSLSWKTIQCYGSHRTSQGCWLASFSTAVFWLVNHRGAVGQHTRGMKTEIVVVLKPTWYLQVMVLSTRPSLCPCVKLIVSLLQQVKTNCYTADFLLLKATVQLYFLIPQCSFSSTVAPVKCFLVKDGLELNNRSVKSFSVLFLAGSSKRK